MADIIPDQSISGNKISGGVITDFQSTGIQDLSTRSSLVVTDGTITVDSIRTKVLNGNISLNGNMSVSGSVNFAENIVFNKDLSIQGNLSATTLTVQKLIANITQETKEPITFTAQDEDGLNGMGLVWSTGSDTNSSFIFKNGVLSANTDLDIGSGHSFSIGGQSILNSTILGPSVTTSSLTQVGRLNGLIVDGNVQINSRVEVNGSVQMFNNLTVAGTGTFTNITAGVITASKIVTPDGSSTLGQFNATQESGLIGQGLSWNYGGGARQLVYRDGLRLWSSLNIDLDANLSYKINGATVITQNSLGTQILNSNLQEVGVLNSLDVSGNSNLGDFAFFNASDARLGIGTMTPNAALEIADNGVSMIVGSQFINTASIGTYTNHNLCLITDNTSRIIIKNSGQIEIGNPIGKTADVTIYGTLTVNRLITDTQIDKVSPLEFKATTDTGIYGLGMVWTDGLNQRSFVLRAGPERIVSSVGLEVAQDQEYFVNGTSVLNATTLGGGVVNSNLSTVGALKSLTVVGTSSFADASFTSVISPIVTTSSIKSNLSIGLYSTNDQVFFGDSNGISIGNNQNTNRPIRVYGQLAVGVTTPDPDVNFTVTGPVSIGGKKFITGTEAPTTGNFVQGDICWNQNPVPGNFVGWVCVASGTPGEWRSFGTINIQ